MTMQENIELIERLAGSKVFTGTIPGTRDTEQQWAYVDLPEYRLQIPAATVEAAVDELLSDVTQWAWKKAQTDIVNCAGCGTPRRFARACPHCEGSGRHV